MRRRSIRLVAVTLAMIASAGCATPTPTGPGATNATPAAPAPPTPPPPAVSPGPSEPAGDVLAGESLATAERLFVENCATCHLKAGTGAPKLKKDGIPNFADAAWQSKESDEDLHEAISNGEGKVMPAFEEDLSDAEIDLLVRYIRTLPGPANASAGRSAKGTDPSERKASGPPKS